MPIFGGAKHFLGRGFFVVFGRGVGRRPDASTSVPLVRR